MHHREDEERSISAVIDRLALAYPDAPRSYIDVVVRAELKRFDDGTIRGFVPVLVEKRSRIILRTTGVGRTVLSGIGTPAPSVASATAPPADSPATGASGTTVARRTRAHRR